MQDVRPLRTRSLLRQPQGYRIRHVRIRVGPRPGLSKTAWMGVSPQSAAPNPTRSLGDLGRCWPNFGQSYPALAQLRAISIEEPFWSSLGPMRRDRICAISTEVGPSWARFDPVSADFRPSWAKVPCERRVEPQRMDSTCSENLGPQMAARLDVALDVLLV